jgi:fumarylacetoacetate (FAA) hydrolase
VHRPLLCDVNGKRLGSPHAGNDCTFSFFDLIAHAARTRELATGTLVGSGTVSNHDKSAGFACLMEARLVEQVETGSAKTPFLRFGDTVRLEMLDEAGASIFGAIEQRVARYQR